jgi:hypothetical protein
MANAMLTGARLLALLMAGAPLAAIVGADDEATDASDLADSHAQGIGAT